MTGHESNNEDAELGWLAFRYVAGELTADEQAVFEARLDADQSVREAVAREVELAQAVAVAAGSLTPAAATVMPARHVAERPARFTLRTASWLALGAAASLAIGMLLGRGWTPWTGSENLASQKEAAVQELAGYWQTMETEDDLASREGAVAVDEPAVEVSEDVPGWLLAALEPEEPADSPRREN